MTKNTLLNIAIYICKFLRLIYLLFFIGVTIVFVHFQFSPNSYDSVYFDKISPKGIEFKIKPSSPESKVNQSVDWDKMIALHDLERGSLYFLYFKLVIIILFTYLITKQFQNVITSVKKMETFKKNNALAFKRIGTYLFIIFLLDILTVLNYSIGDQYYEKNTIHMSFTPLLMMLFAFIMSEIFKEGHKISKENELTI